jgi:hypothetical protein
MSGPYLVTATFEGDATYIGSSTFEDFDILEEGIIPSYTGDTIVSTTSSVINLRATFRHEDASYGDVTKMQIIFRIYDNYGVLVTSSSVIGVDPTDTAGIGFATTT